MNLTRLDPYDEHGALRVVVESPRGASLKFAYQPSLELFAVARALPLGVVYPYDWGFVPGTRGDDGDWWLAIAVRAGFGASEFTERLRLLTQTVFGKIASADAKKVPSS